ncbi:hypothetical protein A0U40_18455 [[Bacillus] sp. KCTC 13219]|nr:hypothetical protein A0U40_18455 [[Bacillus] sp. KCTC 13219]
MSSQMYADLIVKELTRGKGAETGGFKYPLVGTLIGDSVQVDALSVPIPLSEFDLLVDERTTIAPAYTNGDRLFIIPANDGKQLVIAGRLI